MKLLVKICGVREKENARELAALRPDYLGFIFYAGSKRSAEPDTVEKWISIIPPEIKKVGVFVNAPIGEIVSIARRLALNYVQLHGHEDVGFCGMLREGLPEIQLIKSFRVSKALPSDTLRPFEDMCSYFLFDSPSERYGGSGEPFNWALLADYSLSTPFFLSGGIESSRLASVRELQRALPQLIGIDASSKVELSPGRKSIPLVQELIKEVRR